MQPTKYDLPCTAPWPFHPLVPVAHLPGSAAWGTLHDTYLDAGKRLADWLYCAVPSPIVDAMRARLTHLEADPAAGAAVRMPRLPEVTA